MHSPRDLELAELKTFIGLGIRFLRRLLGLLDKLEKFTWLAVNYIPYGSFYTGLKAIRLNGTEQSICQLPIVVKSISKGINYFEYWAKSAVRWVAYSFWIRRRLLVNFCDPLDPFLLAIYKELVRLDDYRGFIIPVRRHSHAYHSHKNIWIINLLIDLRLCSG